MCVFGVGVKGHCVGGGGGGGGGQGLCEGSYGMLFWSKMRQKNTRERLEGGEGGGGWGSYKRPNTST